MSKKLLYLLKPLVIWSIVLIIFFEIILHWTLNDLPNKFLNHTTGPIRRLSQYSKENVRPNNYIAMLGDSNVYGFGPWLYDNSWSMDQPNFATHHLLHESLGKDIMAFGYPGYGTLGACLSMVSEREMFDSSWFWSDVEYPSQILVVCYEGNDLINNLHEIEQRGFDINTSLSKQSVKGIEQIIIKESEKLRNSWTFVDHSASWNLCKGIIGNYLNKYKQSETQNSPHSDEILVNEGPPLLIEENIAIINGKRVPLGYCEGSALHLTANEINLSMEIARQALMYLRNKFQKSEIILVYLPSSLSIYNFSDCAIRPATLEIKDSTRNDLFEPSESLKKNEWLRAKFLSLANSLGFRFIDTTPFLKEKTNFHLLHGPRDPIHLNRVGYEFFSQAITNGLKKSTLANRTIETKGE